MGTKFEITDNAVSRHASNMDTAVSQLNGQARAFITAIEPLPAVWKGTSFQSWQQLTERWNQAIAGLNKALQDIQARVSTAGKHYDTGQQEQAAQLKQAAASANWDAAKFRG